MSRLLLGTPTLGGGHVSLLLSGNSATDSGRESRNEPLAIWKKDLRAEALFAQGS